MVEPRRLSAVKLKSRKYHLFQFKRVFSTSPVSSEGPKETQYSPLPTCCSLNNWPPYLRNHTGISSFLFSFRRHDRNTHLLPPPPHALHHPPEAVPFSESQGFDRHVSLSQGKHDTGLSPDQRWGHWVPSLLRSKAKTMVCLIKAPSKGINRSLGPTQEKGKRRQENPPASSEQLQIANY